MTSLQDINYLPSSDVLKKRLQGLALAEAIIMPEWQYRYFSFNCNWDGCGKEMLASMRDGSGNEFFILFSTHGVIGKVFSFECKVINAELAFNNIPLIFSKFKNEPAFNIKNVSYFFWKTNFDKYWATSPNNLTNYPLLGFLADDFLSIYYDWATSYYEINFDKNILTKIILSLKVTSEELDAINPNINLDDMSNDLLEIFDPNY